MKITQSTETIKARCTGLFSLCYAAVDIMANDKTISELIIKLFDKVKAEPEKFLLNYDELKIIDKLLEKPETGWLNRAMWKIEELGMLLWVLNIIEELPPVWQQFDEKVLKRMKDINNVANIRNENELDKYKEHLQTINWRFHFDFFQRMGTTGDKGMNDKVIENKVNELKEKGVIDEVVDGDIGFEGISFPKLGYFKKDSIKNIAETRLKVFEWLEVQDEDND